MLTRSSHTPLNLLLAFMALLACAICASAQADLGPQKNAASSSSQLNITANAVKAIQLDISTAASGATVVGNTGRTSTGVFSLDFGTVDGLGLSTGSANVTVDTTNPAGALYTTPVSLTPRYSGHGTSSSSISVMMSGTAGNASGRGAAREGASATTTVAPSTTLANIFTTAASSGTAVTRYVGVFVSNANGASAVSGALTAQLIYQVTVP